jgi:hypothetical protein
MTRYLVDPVRSSMTATTRPMLDRTAIPVVTTVAGTVDVVDDVPSGTITVTVAGEPPTVTEIDLAGTRPELAADLEPGVVDGALVLRGRTTRPAGAFGLTGPPLLNPTIQLSWRLVLAPA